MLIFFLHNTQNPKLNLFISCWGVILNKIFTQHNRLSFGQNIPLEISSCADIFSIHCVVLRKPCFLDQNGFAIVFSLRTLWSWFLTQPLLFHGCEKSCFSSFQHKTPSIWECSACQPQCMVQTSLHVWSKMQSELTKRLDQKLWQQKVRMCVNTEKRAQTPKWFVQCQAILLIRACFLVRLQDFNFFGGGANLESNFGVVTHAPDTWCLFLSTCRTELGCAVAWKACNQIIQWGLSFFKDNRLRARLSTEMKCPWSVNTHQLKGEILPSIFKVLLFQCWINSVLLWG